MAHTRCGWRAVVAVVIATALAACSATTQGRPVIAGDQIAPDGTVIARLNTGSYATTPSPPPGSAGDNATLQATLEGHRLAPYVTGPWQVFDELNEWGPILANWTGPISDAEMLRTASIMSPPFIDSAVKHGFFAGFNTYRVDRRGSGRALINVVLEFPDPAAASAAADEMAAVNLPPAGGPPGEPIAVPYQPDARAMAYDNPDGSKFVQAVLAVGPMLFFSSSYVGANPLITTVTPVSQTSGLIGDQRRLISGFTPTDPAKRADLPLDPTGDLYSRTLIGPDGAVPFIVGEWEPTGWLHFEANPITAKAQFDDAGLEVVSQRLTTVFRTHNADGAAGLADAMAADMKAMTDVKPIEGVPGLPSAKCFERLRGYMEETVAMSFRRVLWRYKCVGHADRYTYTAFSNSDIDLHQQMAAQYRLLVGR